MSVQPELVNLANRPMPVYVPTLRRISAVRVAHEIEEGFMYDKLDVDLNDPHAAPFSTVSEARGRLFRYDARRILKALSRDASVARQVFNSVPASGAMYCAMACIPKLDQFSSVTSPAKTNTPFNATDISCASFVGPIWQNLTSLTLKSSCITSRFLDFLSLGSAKSTLKKVDFSMSPCGDEDLLPLIKFRNLESITLDYCEYISIKLIETVALAMPWIIKLSLNFTLIKLEALLTLLRSTVDRNLLLPNLQELSAQSDDWSEFVDEALAVSFNMDRPNFCRFDWIPDYEISTSGSSTQQTRFSKTPFLLVAVALDVLPKSLTKFDTKENLHLRRLHTMYLPTELLHKAPMMTNLRRLVLGCPHVDQAQLDVVASSCCYLRKLFMVAPKLPVAGLDLSILKQVVQLSIADAQMGCVSSLPPSLKSFTISILSTTTGGSSSLQTAVLACQSLEKLDIVSADQDLENGFPSSFMRDILSKLQNLTHLTLDCEAFSPEHDPAQRYVAIHHERLQFVRIFAADNQLKPLPFLEWTPALTLFHGARPDCLSSVPAMKSTCFNIRSMTLSQVIPGRSVNMKHYYYAFNTHPLSKSPPLIITSSPQSPFVGEVVCDIIFHGAPRSTLSGGAKTRRFIRRMQLDETDINNEILCFMKRLESLRELEVTRSAGPLKIEALQWPGVMHFSITSLKFEGDLSLNAPFCRNLVSLKISSVQLSGNVLAIQNLPQLRSVLVSKTRPRQLTIKENPILTAVTITDVATCSFCVQGLSIKRLRVENLSRLTESPAATDDRMNDSVSPRSDYGTPRSLIDSPHNAEESASQWMSFQLPQLETAVWGVDHYVDAWDVVLASSTKLQLLTLPDKTVEGSQTKLSEWWQRFPKLSVISLSDADVFSPTKQHIAPNTV